MTEAVAITESIEDRKIELDESEVVTDSGQVQTPFVSGSETIAITDIVPGPNIQGTESLAFMEDLGDRKLGGDETVFIVDTWAMDRGLMLGAEPIVVSDVAELQLQVTPTRDNTYLRQASGTTVFNVSFPTHAPIQTDREWQTDPDGNKFLTWGSPCMETAFTIAVSHRDHPATDTD